jgi:uncharacterized protein (DUF2384 family)
MPLGDFSDRASPLRPCTAGRFAAKAPGLGYLKVPFARCADGIARHVTAIPALYAGPFRCLDCEERLTLRRPRDKRAHFAHRPDSLCAGETALHRYAKDLLEQRKTLTLPALTLQEEGLSESVFKLGVYAFEGVVPERNLGTFQPDAIVTYQGAELAVEFLVSHAVGEEKRAKVLERDISMVEVDLSQVRAGQVSAEELDELILHSAPRRWIHHRRRAAAAKKLADQIARKRAHRGRRLKWHIEKKVRPAYPEGWTDKAIASVKHAGLGHLLDLDVDGEHWFAAPRDVWQAEALDVHVIDPSRQFSPGGRNIALKGAWPNEHSLASKLPEWMIRSDLSAYPPKRLAEAGFDRSTYGSPDDAVWRYFAALHALGQAVFWSPEEQSFFIEPDLHGRLHRRVELHRMVTKLLAAVEHQDPECGFRYWASSYQTGGTTPAELVELGGEGYRELFRRISAIGGMLAHYSRKVVDDLCGLPVEEIRRRNMDAIAADVAERVRKERKASDARRNSIQRQAEQMLEDAAGEWLARLVQPEHVSITEFASSSDEKLCAAERWLAAAGEQRRQTRIAAERVAALRAELTEAARHAFGNPSLANLFLNTGQPKIGGRHPIDFCDTKDALKILVSLLPKRR